jgi:hypothetical protein
MLSLNEVQSTVLKAARGAGLPLGQAEDLARVAAYLMGIRGDAGVITRALQEPITDVQATWQDSHVTVSGSAAMVAPVICDAFRMGSASATFAQVDHSAYIGAALAVEGVPLWWEGCTIRRGDSEVLPAKAGPVAVPQKDWDIWLALAAKTYVPESETSRRAGAGAGLTDND